jgi:DNA-binding NtrC family response regulator
LAGAVFELPSLSERRADIPLLAESLLAELCPGASLEPSAKEWLSQQRWPGNVRELRNAIRRTALLAPTAQLTARHFQAHAQLRFRKQPSASIADVEHLPYRQARDIVLRRFEYRFLECAAQACGGDRKAMAKQLGVGLRTLRTMLRDHGLDARTQRPS